MYFSKRRQRSAFTLVELLTVMALLAIVAGFLLTAVAGVTQTAREARTRAIIAAIDSVIQEQYDSYQYRPLPVEPINVSNPANSPNGRQLVGYEVLAREVARARLTMVRDLQRMEMPDRLADIRDPDPSPTRPWMVSNPLFVRAAANPVVMDAAGNILGTRDQNTERNPVQISHYARHSTVAPGTIPNVPNKLTSYFSRMPDSATEQHQGAECLYLIMTNSFIGSEPAINSIPAQNIGDTDGDGLLEILDGWGQPLGFIRWPVGYFDLGGSTDVTVLDTLDPFRADFAHATSQTAADATNVNSTPQAKIQPWAMRPLILSAGSDGEFGIATNPHTAGGEVATFDYAASPYVNWPVDAAHMGVEQPGRGTAYNMIDPYMRQFVAANTSSGTFTGLLPGQQLPGGLDARADNITNQALRASQ